MHAADSATKHAKQGTGYVWRDLMSKDIESACRLSETLGWPHRREDWTQLLNVGQGVALEHEGRLIGTGLCIPQGALATIGLIVVDEAYRGLGLGRQMMERAMALAGDLPMMLVATAAGAPLYEQFGFVNCNQVTQHQGQSRPVRTTQDPLVQAMTPADRAAIEQLADVGSGRGPVLEVALVSADAVKVYRDSAGSVLGFAMRREFGRGQVIGPVIAGNRRQAEALVDALLAGTEGGFVRMDILGDALEANWLADRGLPSVSRIIQMSRGELPKAGSRNDAESVRQFALTTQALG